MPRSGGGARPGAPPEAWLPRPVDQGASRDWGRALLGRLRVGQVGEPPRTVAFLHAEVATFWAQVQRSSSCSSAVCGQWSVWERAAQSHVDMKPVWGGW